jgi:hypothetical protein
MPRPERVTADIGDAGHAAEITAEKRAVYDFCHCRAFFPIKTGIEIKHFFPHWDKIAQMFLLPGVFLRDLELQNLVGPLKPAQQRRHRFTNLEVHRAVFDLKNYIISAVNYAAGIFYLFIPGVSVKAYPILRLLRVY